MPAVEKLMQILVVLLVLVVEVLFADGADVFLAAVISVSRC